MLLKSERLRWILRLITIGSFIGVSCAALSHVHPAADAVGVFLIYFTAVSIGAGMVAFLAGLGFLALFNVAVVVGALALLYPLYASIPTAGKELLVLRQHNLRFDNATLNIFGSLDEDIDIMTLQEVIDPNKKQVLELNGKGWVTIICDFGTVGGAAVVSRLPVSTEELNSGCLKSGGVAWMRVETVLGSITIASVHLQWPWPYEQKAQVDELIRGLAELPRPVLVAGDFNQTPWSSTLKRIENATGTQTLPGLRTTLKRAAGLVGLSIDHILVPKGWGGKVRISDKNGSDHFALISRIKGPSKAKAESVKKAQSPSPD